MIAPTDKDLETYSRLMTLNGAAQIFHTAQSLGVLDALEPGPLGVDAIAERCGVTERPLALLLDALGALGVTERDGERHRLGAVARYLTHDYRSLGNQYWARLPDLLRTGAPCASVDGERESERHYARQAEPLAWMMAASAEAAAVALDIGGSRRNLRILDVGAGSAVWSLTFARHDHGAAVTALDWPAVLEVARRMARQAGAEDRFSTIAGSYHEVALPSGAFDLAILGNVTHLETAEGNLSVFRRIRSSLRAGGELVILDNFPGLPAGDLPRAIYALGLALRTERGRVYAPRELMELLRRAGFSVCDPLDLDAPPFTTGLLLARAKA